MLGMLQCGRGPAAISGRENYVGVRWLSNSALRGGVEGRENSLAGKSSISAGNVCTERKIGALPQALVWQK